MDGLAHAAGVLSGWRWLCGARQAVLVRASGQVSGVSVPAASLLRVPHSQASAASSYAAKQAASTRRASLQQKQWECEHRQPPSLNTYAQELFRRVLRMADATFPVQLWQYDLTQGMARVLGPMLLGRPIEGVWHTSIVVHGVEYLYGYGVQRAVPGTTPFGQPLHKIDLGNTQVPKDLVEDMVSDLGVSKFQPNAYNLIENNCNHFSDALSKLLVDKGIPEAILTQHEVLLHSPMGQQLMPMLMQMEGTLGSAAAGGQAPPGTQPSPGS